MRSVACSLPRTARGFTALLLVGLVLLLDALAAVPRLHECLHHDAAQSAHHCAVTLFAHGQVDAAGGETPLAVSLNPVELTFVAVVSTYAPAIGHLPAERAPPVASFHS
jgi:hypothetical protein